MLAVARNMRSSAGSLHLCMESSFMDVSPARLKVVPRLLSASKILTLDQGFRSQQLWGSRGGVEKHYQL